MLSIYNDERELILDNSRNSRYTSELRFKSVNHRLILNIEYVQCKIIICSSVYLNTMDRPTLYALFIFFSTEAAVPGVQLQVLPLY